MFAIVFPRKTPLDASRLAQASFRERLIIIRDFCAGIAYLHSLGLAHRDIKPENCVAEEVNGYIKAAFVADVGLVRKIEGSHCSTKCRGTPFFIDPHAMATGEYRLVHDLHSLATFIACVAAGVARPQNENHSATLLSSGNDKVKLMLALMQDSDLERRPSIQAVVDWASSVNESDLESCLRHTP
jgi:hypothetical protein